MINSVAAVSTSVESAQSVVSIIAGLAVILTAVGAAFMWFHRVLSSIDGTVRKELNHNGGESLKDLARDASQRARKVEAALDVRISESRERDKWTLESFAKLEARLDQAMHDIGQARTVLNLHVANASKDAAALWAWAQGVQGEVPLDTYLATMQAPLDKVLGEVQGRSGKEGQGTTSQQP